MARLKNSAINQMLYYCAISQHCYSEQQEEHFFLKEYFSPNEISGEKKKIFGFFHINIKRQANTSPQEQTHS